MPIDDTKCIIVALLNKIFKIYIHIKTNVRFKRTFFLFMKKDVAFQIFLCIMVFGENWNKFIHGGKR